MLPQADGVYMFWRGSALANLNAIYVCFKINQQASDRTDTGKGRVTLGFGVAARQLG